MGLARASNSACGGGRRCLFNCFSQITFRLISLSRSDPGPRDLFVHAKDLFVEAKPLTWHTSSTVGPRTSAYRKRLSRVKDAG